MLWRSAGDVLNTGFLCLLRHGAQTRILLGINVVCSGLIELFMTFNTRAITQGRWPAAIQSTTFHFHIVSDCRNDAHIQLVPIRERKCISNEV